MIVYDLVNLDSKGSPRKVLDKVAHDGIVYTLSLSGFISYYENLN